MPAAPTTDRLLAAAATLFATRGFRATTMRDIAARAGVNLAAAHYHYGSKKALYVAVLRQQFGRVRQALADRGVAPAPATLARLSRDEAVRLLRARADVMANLLVGPSPSLHAVLLQRECCDPTEALPFIVDEFLQPLLDELVALLGCLAPDLDRDTLRLCAFSVIAQALFYRFSEPATLHLLGRETYPRGFASRLADHLSEFSLGGLERVARRTRRAPR